MPHLTQHRFDRFIDGIEHYAFPLVPPALFLIEQFFVLNYIVKANTAHAMNPPAVTRCSQQTAEFATEDSHEVARVSMCDGSCACVPSRSKSSHSHRSDKGPRAHCFHREGQKQK